MGMVRCINTRSNRNYAILFVQSTFLPQNAECEVAPQTMRRDYGVNVQTNDRVTATLIDVDLITRQSADKEEATTTEKKKYGEKERNGRQQKPKLRYETHHKCGVRRANGWCQELAATSN